MLQQVFHVVVSYICSKNNWIICKSKPYFETHYVAVMHHFVPSHSGALLVLTTNLLNILPFLGLA